MAIFGVIVEDKELPKQFFQETKERIGSGNLARSPFNGGIISIKNINIIKMSPIYPNYAIVGALFLTAACVIWPRVWLMFVTGFFYLISLFWSARFYYFMLKQGLKKKGYRGEIRFLKPKEIIEEVYFNGN